MSLPLRAPWPRLARAQGLYFALTGLWPLVSMRSFEAVTGPKTDRWLVRTVGVLVAVAGASLLVASRRPRTPVESAVLAVGAATGLATIDAVYATRGRIARVYLLDAVVEALLVVGWLTGRRDGRRRSSSSRSARALATAKARSSLL